MVSFTEKYHVAFEGASLTIGDILTTVNKITIRVLGITSIQIVDKYVIVEGYGIAI